MAYSREPRVTIAMAATNYRLDPQFEELTSIEACERRSEENFAKFTPGFRYRLANMTGMTFEGFNVFKMRLGFINEMEKDPNKREDLLKILYLVSARGTNWSKISKFIEEKYKTEFETYMQNLGIQYMARGRVKSDVRTLGRLVHCFPLLSVRIQEYISGQWLSELPWPFRTPAIASVLPCDRPHHVQACMWAAYRRSVLSGISEREAIKNAHDFVLISVRNGVLSTATKERYYQEVLFNFEDYIMNMANCYLKVCHRLNIKAYGAGDEVAPPNLCLMPNYISGPMMPQMTGMQNYTPKSNR